MSVKKSMKDAKRNKRKSKSNGTMPPLKYISLGEPAEPVVDMWFGYKDSLSAERNSDANPTVLTMVCEICEYNFEHFQEKFPGRFKAGHWFVSAGICDNLVISGPFEKMQQAFDFSRDTYQTEYFKFGGW